MPDTNLPDFSRFGQGVALFGGEFSGILLSGDGVSGRTAAGSRRKAPPGELLESTSVPEKLTGKINPEFFAIPLRQNNPNFMLTNTRNDGNTSRRRASGGMTRICPLPASEQISDSSRRNIFRRLCSGLSPITRGKNRI